MEGKSFNLRVRFLHLFAISAIAQLHNCTTLEQMKKLGKYHCSRESLDIENFM